MTRHTPIRPALLAATFGLLALSAGAFADGMADPQPGLYQCWGDLRLSGDRTTGQLTGTFTGTFEAETGTWFLTRDANGTWTGTWAEQEIGRSGTLFSFIDTEYGFYADFDTLHAGTLRNGNPGPVSGGGFRCHWQDQ